MRLQQLARRSGHDRGHAAGCKVQDRQLKKRTSLAVFSSVLAGPEIFSRYDTIPACSRGPL
jgi:hypothetical protein